MTPFVKAEIERLEKKKTQYSTLLKRATKQDEVKELNSRIREVTDRIKKLQEPYA